MAQSVQTQEFEYCQTYQKSSSSSDTPIPLVPPGREGNWELLSCHLAPGAGSLIVIWRSRIHWPGRPAVT